MSKRDSYIFYRSFFEAVSELPDKDQLEIYKAISEYSLNFNEIELKGLPKTIFTLIKPQLEANNRRFINGTKGGEHGKKGGRPETPKKPQKKPLKNPKPTPNKNVNVNGNGNVNPNGNNNNNIPTEDEFIAYAVKQVSDIKTEAVRLKYRAWVESDWHTGGDKPKPIKNWKTTLLNTLPHMERNAGNKPFKYEF